MRDWHAWVRTHLQLHGIRPEHEQDVIDDLATQLDDAWREALARGLTDADATAAAESHITDWSTLAQQVATSRRLALPTLARLETCASDGVVDGRRGAGVLTSILQDLRFAVRLKRHRGYFAFATATLAVAVGVNLIVFTIVNALWLRPLPFKDADRLVAITGRPYFGFNGPLFKPFEAVAGQVVPADWMSDMRPRLTFDRVVDDVETIGVTPGFFEFLGLPVRGRDFAASDDVVGADPVAIISDRLWSVGFGRSADVIGTVTPARPFPIRIVGVAPPDFQGAQRGDRADVWIPRRLVPRLAAPPGAVSIPNEMTAFMQPFARLHQGDTAASVSQRLIETLDAETMEGMAIVPLREVYGSPTSPTIAIREENSFGVVAGLALLVLLGGCATLMALVLVHYERRRRDQAVKVALGASRSRMMRELLLELGLIAVAGTAGAVVVATWGLGAIPSLSLPGGVDLGRLDLSMDWRVFAAAIGMSVLTLVVAAWTPVRRFTMVRLAGDLIAGPATTASASSHRIRQTLLALHVSSTIVVLVAAGLFVRAVTHGFGAAPGFDAGRTAFVSVSAFTVLTGASADASPDAWREATTARNSRLQDALRALPGVQEVAHGTTPISAQATNLLAPRSVEAAGISHELSVGRVFGGAELLHALGVPILAGRSLTAADAATRPAPAVITASLASRLWPDGDPLGDVVSLGGGRTGGEYQVVGIARDFVYGSLASPASGVIVTASNNLGGNAPQFVVRSNTPQELAAAVRAVVKDIVPEATSLVIDLGADVLARDLGRQRLGAWFFSGFGLAALMLGVGGVFGLVAYMAESRRREFAVRLALGATQRDLVQHGVRAALVPVTVGVVAGLIGAALVARLFTSLLTGLSSLDPLTYATVAVTMLGSATLAGLSAAWRLRRLMPTDALRME
jgi:putative ABC transport system permease protein